MIYIYRDIMNKNKVLDILNNKKVITSDLIKIINKSNIKIKDVKTKDINKLKQIDLIKIIMTKYNLHTSDLMYFYTVKDLKKMLQANKPLNIEKYRKHELFQLYIDLRNKLITNNFRVVSHLEQGKRDYMEDNVFYFNNNYLHFSSIFDGHGGDECSLFLRKNLFQNFQKTINKQKKIKSSLITTFAKLNETFLNRNVHSGSTCNTLIINKKINKFYVANVGDSRAIICDKYGKAHTISKDHKPTDKKERNRIIKSGGYVEYNRVNGILAMSRAFGDKNIAKYITAVPDIFEGLLQNINYIVQGSDGLYDVLTNQAICNFINNLIKHKVSLNRIPKMLIRHAIDVKKSTDNVSVIITFI